MAKDFGIYESFGKRFRTALASAGYTKQSHRAFNLTLSKLFNVSVATINDWLWGRKLPSMDSAIMIATELNVYVEWLLTGRGPEIPPPSDEKANHQQEELALEILGSMSREQASKWLEIGRTLKKPFDNSPKHDNGM